MDEWMKEGRKEGMKEGRNERTNERRGIGWDMPWLCIYSSKQNLDTPMVYCRVQYSSYNNNCPVTDICRQQILAQSASFSGQAFSSLERTAVIKASQSDPHPYCMDQLMQWHLSYLRVI